MGRMKRTAARTHRRQAAGFLAAILGLVAVAAPQAQEA